MSAVTIAASGGEDARTLFVSAASNDVEGGAIPESICIDSTVDRSREQAGEMGRQLFRRSREFYPASQEALRAVSAALDAINDARGTSHTVEAVADSLGLERPLSEADVTHIAEHIGGGADGLTRHWGWRSWVRRIRSRNCRGGSGGLRAGWSRLGHPARSQGPTPHGSPLLKVSGAGGPHDIPRGGGFCGPDLIDPHTPPCQGRFAQERGTRGTALPATPPTRLVGGAAASGRRGPPGGAPTQGERARGRPRPVRDGGPASKGRNC
jgi:hypothetical protein